MARAGKGYRYHRTDTTAKAIIARLRALGASVYPIGRPVDLVVGFRGVTYLAEVKTLKGKLGAFQEAFMASWAGSRIVVLREVEDADRFLLGAPAIRFGTGDSRELQQVTDAVARSGGKVTVSTARAK